MQTPSALAPFFTLDAYSDLVGRIYDCALDPGGWQAILDEVRSALGFHNGGIGIHGFPAGNIVLLSASAGVPEPYLQKMVAFSDELVAIWGGPQSALQTPLCEPVVLSQVQDPEFVSATRYHNEWAVPQGINDAVTSILMRGDGALCNVTFGRHKDAGPVETAHLEAFRLLFPHMRRAVSISKILDLKTVLSTELASALDALRAAVFLVDADLTVRFANASATAQLAQPASVRMAGSKLTLADPLASEELRFAVAACVSRIAVSVGQSQPIAIRATGSGGPSVIHVLPLPGHAHAAASGRAAAAVFIAGGAAPSAAVIDALRGVYRLTPMEARVMELVGDGLRTAEAAKMLSIGPGTFKTHLLKVLRKTGCKRQADIISLLASFRQI
jgi:DNA-binding CsgD family transcriptional regulator/PAS domain-containing protein